MHKIFSKVDNAGASRSVRREKRVEILWWMHSKYGTERVQWADTEQPYPNRQQRKREDHAGQLDSVQGAGVFVQLDVQPEIHQLQRKI